MLIIFAEVGVGVYFGLCDEECRDAGGSSGGYSGGYSGGGYRPRPTGQIQQRSKSFKINKLIINGITFEQK